jgi:hypothetical protein
MWAALFGLMAVCPQSSCRSRRGPISFRSREEKRRTIEVHVQYSVRRGDDAGDGRQRFEGGDELLRDGARRFRSVLAS